MYHVYENVFYYLLRVRNDEKLIILKRYIR